MTKWIDEVLGGKWDGVTVLATYKDRVTRFGLELYERIFLSRGITLEFVEAEEEKTDEQEMTEDLLNILHIFSCKQYSARGAASCTKEIETPTIRKIYKLHKSGLSVRQIESVLWSEGDKATSKSGGETRVSRRIVLKYLNDLELLEKLGIVEENGKMENSFEIFLKGNVKRDGRKTLKSSELGRRYEEWYEGMNGEMAGKPKLSRHAMARVMRDKGFEKKKMQEGRQYYLGLTFK